VIVGGLCNEFVEYVIVGGLCDEYYMSVMNIIYACDDTCDFCEYLRLLEKKKKKRKPLRREQTPMLSAKGVSQICGVQTFAESRMRSSRRRARLQREPDIWLSAKEWPPLLTEGRAVTVRGPSARAEDTSRRMSAERIQ
jgi:hypothetical protein